MKVNVPDNGEKITLNGKGGLNVPNNPIIPFIEGDGIGTDITPVMKKVVDAAVEKAYAGNKKIAWMEVFAGEKAVELYGEAVWLPEETLALLKEYVVSIKGPMTTPTGQGIRSLNVSIRQTLDLYACVRPVRYFDGIQSPLKAPQNTNMVIFRENTEDIYAGIEWETGTDDCQKVLDFLIQTMGVQKIRFPETTSIGVKPVSISGSKRLIRRAIEYAIDNNRQSVALVHKGNIMKFTEGGFMKWGYELAAEEFDATIINNGPWCEIINPNNGEKIVIKDVIADNFLQQILINPKDYDVVATLNLNGDYISDALAAQVGGIGIAPGANISDNSAVFEATHGSAPRRAGQNVANPGSLLLSAEMMLRHLAWNEAADVIVTAMASVIVNGFVTYDLARGNEDNATILSTSDFGDKIISVM